MPILKLRLGIPNIPFLFNPDLIGGGVLSVDTSFITIDSDIFRADNHYNLMRGPELVTNGIFLTDSNWTKGTGWTIANGKASNNGSSGSNNLRQSNILTIGSTYKITITVSDYVSGNVQVSAGATPRGEMSANGTYTFHQVATPTDDFYIIANSFTGSINNVSVTEDRTFGPELVLNGDFSQEGIELAEFSNSNIVPNDSSDSTTISLGSNSYRSEAFGNTNDSRPRVQLNGSGIVTGKTYKVTYTPVSFTGSTVFDFIENGTRIVNNHDASVAKTFYFVASDSTDAFDFDGSQTFRSDYTLSVKEVGQDWTIGTGWSVDQANSKAIATSSPSGQSVGQNSVASSLSNGSLAQVSFQVLDITQGSFGIYFSGTLVGSMNSAGTFNGTFIKGTETSFYIRALGTTSGSISNISVKEDRSLNIL